MRYTYKHTLQASFISYAVQALVINFIPLLFVQFQREFGLDLIKITHLVTLNFIVQLSFDALSIPLINWLNYRKVALLAHLFTILGLLLLVFVDQLPFSSYSGLVIATIFYSAGGGLIEVVTNPIVEAIPSDNNAKMMSLLHSFYSWGFVGVVLITAIFFQVFSIGLWRILSLIWLLIPVYCFYLFIFVPLPEVVEEVDEPVQFSHVLRNKTFWIFALMMFCAGASEMAVSQWLSYYMETLVGYSKFVGDTAGPLIFAFMMGLSRTYYGLGKHSIALEKYIRLCLIVLIVATLGLVFFPTPLMSVISSALYGGAIGILWPGAYALAAKGFSGGHIVFSLMALLGDLGCAFGPLLIGQVSALWGNNLQIGIFSSLIYPIFFLILLKMNKNNVQV